MGEVDFTSSGLGAAVGLLMVFGKVKKIISRTIA